MKSITLENNEVILINGKLYVANENFLANDNSYNLECIDSIINKDLKNEILSKESNGKIMNVSTLNLRYGKYLKDW